MNFGQLLKRALYDMPKGKLGKVYVKYGEPLDIHDYAEKSANLPFVKSAYNLTKQFYKFH